MSSVDFLAQEKIWFDKPRYDEAERRFYERINGSSEPTKVPAPVLEVQFSLSCHHSHLKYLYFC